jgi:hypothetical protein
LKLKDLSRSRRSDVLKVITLKDLSNQMSLSNYETNKQLFLKNFDDLFRDHPLQWVTINTDGPALVYPTAASAHAGQKDSDAYTAFIANFVPEMIGPIESTIALN